MSVISSMKFALCLGFASVLGVWTAFALSADPEWSVSSTMIDLGALPMMSTAYARVDITNHGSIRSLTIDEVDSDCGCIVTDTGGRTLGAGESSRIDAFLTTDVFAGPLCQNIKITSGRGEERMIGITGLVIAPFTDRVAYAESITLEVDPLYEGLIVGAVCFAGVSQEPLASRLDPSTRSLTIEVGQRYDRLEIVLEMEGAEVEKMTRRVVLD